MKLKLLLALWILVLFSVAVPAFARKKIIRGRQSFSVSVRPRLRADRQALLLVFSGMNQASSVSYNLIYQSGEVGQGVQGNYDAAGGNTQKELVFGTCSGAVCTYHTNIKDMVLEIKINLKDGRTLTQKYGIKP